EQSDLNIICNPMHFICVLISELNAHSLIFFFFQAEDGIRDGHVTGVQTCALPIYSRRHSQRSPPRLTRASWPGRRKKSSRCGRRSEERRVGKECRSRWSTDH